MRSFAQLRNVVIGIGVLAAMSFGVSTAFAEASYLIKTPTATACKNYCASIGFPIWSWTASTQECVCGEINPSEPGDPDPDSRTQS